MNKNLNKKNIIIIIITFMIILSGIVLMFYINLKDNSSIEVEATVKMIGNNYIIVEDKNKKEYSIETTYKYKVGDKVDFIIKNIKKNSNPIKGEIVQINLVSRNISFKINDDNQNNTDINNTINNEKEILETTYSDSDVVEYFTNLDNDLTNYTKDKNIGERLKEGFITIVDFIFYDGKIKGKTFDELTTNAKIQILQIAYSIDQKIEKYFPDYKETISTTGKRVYTNVKAKTIELYLDITTKVCKNNSDICQTAKEGLRSLKDNFSLTWDFIKEIGTDSLNKLKEWYEVWKSC